MSVKEKQQQQNEPLFPMRVTIKVTKIHEAVHHILRWIDPKRLYSGCGDLSFDGQTAHEVQR